MSIIKSPHKIALEIAKRAREKRLKLNFSQKTLSEKSGVSYSTLKKFEQTGQIALQYLLKIALVLDELENFQRIFANGADELPKSLDQLLNDSSRKRGRK